MSTNKDFRPPEFFCPDCQEIFDSETRFPFLGSCGHSVCGCCVNETKSCPVCKKEGAFVAKQKNKLAAEIFATLMKTKEYQFPAILEPKYHPFFDQILNHLDHRSFVKLAATCETMFDVCFTCNGVKIPYDIPCLDLCTLFGKLRFEMEPVGGIDVYRSLLKDVDYTGDKFGFLGSKENRKKLQKYPFVFKLQKLTISGIFETKWISQIREFLAEFPITAISRLRANRIDDWPGLVQIVKDFHISDVCIRTRNMPGLAESRSIPDEAAAFFLQNMVRFRIDVPIADGLILNSSTKLLHLKRADISKETFVELVKKFAHSTEEVNWMIHRQSFDTGYYNVFKTVKFYHDEELHGPLPEERPLAFVYGDEESEDEYDDEDEDDDLSWPIDEFKILRADGEYLTCLFYDDHIVFSTSTDAHFDRESDDEESLFGLDDDVDSDSDADGLLFYDSDDVFEDEFNESDEVFEDESNDESDH